MKKYLITGALAFVAGATLTSCHSDDELSGSIIEQKVLAYEEVFKQEFGFNPDHNWGFSSSSSLARARAVRGNRTRSENANANEWADPDKAYGGLLVPPPLTETQIAVVKKYFQTHPNLGYEDPHWSNYFIQQVYKGHTDVPAGCATPEQYKSAAWTESNQTYIIASDHMDHLVAVDPSKNIVDHINNFNHGDCSENDHVLDNGGNANDGPFHTDKIMYMRNSTTKSFGYYNSDGSLYHTEYTGLVSYKTIMEAMGAEADCLNDDWERSFMGFDFEQIVDDRIYAGQRNYGNYCEANNWQGELISVQYEYYRPDLYGTKYHYLISDKNQYCGTLQTIDPEPDEARVKSLLDEGWLPVTGSANKDWVKVGGCADHYYSDWIVTLTEAKLDRDNPNDITIPIEEGSQYEERTYTRYRYMLTLGESGRVLCEDLGTANASDIDFNDIVFDGYIYNVVPVKSTCVVEIFDGDEDHPHIIQPWSTYQVDEELAEDLGYTITDVYLLAGGGTIPVTVGGIKLKDTEGFNTTDKVLINTVDDRDLDDVKRYGNTYENSNTFKQPTVLRGIEGIDNLNDIKIIVQYGQQIYELKAYAGAVPNKICVPIKTKWPYERVEINQAYNFNDYVKTGNSRETWKVNYTGNNRQELTLTVTDDEGKTKVLGYTLIDDKYNEALWLNPTEAQKANLYHGETTCPEGNNPDAYYKGDGVDITDIPYASLLRETNVILDDTTGLPEESYTSETKTYGGGYNRDDDPVLVRKRN